jgi:hypothetical protein
MQTLSRIPRPIRPARTEIISTAAGLASTQRRVGLSSIGRSLTMKPISTRQATNPPTPIVRYGNFDRPFETPSRVSHKPRRDDPSAASANEETDVGDEFDQILASARKARRAHTQTSVSIFSTKVLARTYRAHTMLIPAFKSPALPSATQAAPRPPSLLPLPTRSRVQAELAESSSDMMQSMISSIHPTPSMMSPPDMGNFRRDRFGYDAESEMDDGDGDEMPRGADGGMEQDLSSRPPSPTQRTQQNRHVPNCEHETQRRTQDQSASSPKSAQRPLPSASNSLRRSKSLALGMRATQSTRPTATMKQYKAPTLSPQKQPSTAR